MSKSKRAICPECGKSVAVRASDNQLREHQGLEVDREHSTHFWCHGSGTVIEPEDGAG